MDFPAILDSFPLPLVILDRQGEVCYGNRAVTLMAPEHSHAESLLEVEAALFVIQSDLATLHPSENPTRTIPLPTPLGGVKYHAWVYPLALSDDQENNLLVCLLRDRLGSEHLPQRSSDPLQTMVHPSHLVPGSTQDKNDLAAQVHLLQALLDAIPDPLFFKDRAGYYLGCNQALTEALGRSREDLIGKQVFDVAPPERASMCHNKDQEVFATLRPTSYETSMQYQDGQNHHVVFKKAPFYLPDAGLSGLVGVIQDISPLREAKNRLRRAEERFRTLYQEFPDAVVTIDPQSTRPIDFNLLLPNLLGYSDREEFVATLPPLEQFAVDRQEFLRNLTQILLAGHHEFEIRLKTKPGRTLNILVKARAIEMEGKTVPYLVLRDITAQKMAETALERSREFAETVLKTMHDAVAVIDTRGFKILGANPVFMQEYGLTAGSLGQCPCFKLLGCDYYPGSENHDQCPIARTLQSGGYLVTEQVLVDLAGEKKYLEIATSPIRDADGSISQVVYVARNVSERKQAELRIQELAFYDPLTGMPNRTLLIDRLKKALDRARRNDSQDVAVLFLDLDRFKGINDTMGHRTGDQLLQIVGKRLQGAVRKADTVARLGGDEFVVILADTPEEWAIARVAGKILAALNLPVELDSHEIFTGASIGIALYPRDGEDVDTLLQNADTAMYQAKELGRNSYQFFSEQMNRQAMERLHLENRLRRALEKDELFLLYQPQFQFKSGELCGMEALLRWNHPEFGVIPPKRFISLAEETGLILPIGEWVLRKACQQRKLWQKQGMSNNCKVAVNISSRQFKFVDLADSVEQILAETELDPQLLELELTESLLMDNADRNLSMLRRLKKMGISLAVDDFGTGYSSLSYLKHFPIDCLKIDQSFVRDISSDPEDANIVQAIIVLARSLGLSVLAEGVENRHQLQFLIDHGCRSGQGNYFSPPCDSNDCHEFFSGHRFEDGIFWTPPLPFST